jgi:hypothetical protein
MGYEAAGLAGAMRRTLAARAASTETASVRQTGTGATGTPRTWWPSRPGRSCRDDPL